MSMSRRFISFLFYIGLVCQSAFAALPTVEAPQSSGGSGIMGQAKGYLQDGLVLGGLILAAVMFLNVGTAAGKTFSEVRDGRAGWEKFVAIVVVGIVLLVVIIWLAGKSANILL
ncbi:TIGR03745 family integrating conjugative element membrane protein [Pectobacterium parvum]|uniref:TIGR03745 family integrating conjugative element membrane protein n=1 Tax=Pectobacterium TaxID=122277 RepID=UPI0005C61C23|nr:MULTISPECIES: TIGR03745 family integrating conjugative element membrane protein [Pectobacterium]AZK61342.1 TIGR03745 family integrating conjugative element membrane protein [Pectobacterium versatile]MCU1793502.1 TIGR03745 family integrating conjugative element membrane protein [Pectobacterium polaris]QQG29317.1 TIGR03745 family integrating conjugative element membrane protein [Pectobacterium carotovorum]